MHSRASLVRFRSAGLVATVAAGLILTATPARASGAVPITCGARLTQNAYLAADLDCPTGDGVTVAASITIDLGGHRLTGSRSATGVTVEYPAAPKITHGRLAGWGVGLTVVATTPNPDSVPTQVTIIAVNFKGNATGIAPGDVDANGNTTPDYVVWRSWFESNDVAIGGPVGNTQVTVSGSTFRKNKTAVYFQGDQITITGGITVSKSEFTGNTIGVRCVTSGCQLNDNGFLDNPTAVSTADYFTYLGMTGNTVTGSRIGVDAHDNLSTVLDRNTFSGNATAVSFAGNSGSVTNNVLAANGTAMTLTLPSSDPEEFPAVPVSGNKVSNNTGDGIRITTGGAELADNVSTFNHGWGIYAPGSVDQGGNHANGNGRSPQCVGVVC